MRFTLSVWFSLKKWHPPKLLLVIFLLFFQSAEIADSKTVSSHLPHEVSLNKCERRHSSLQSLLRDAKTANEAGQIERVQCLWLQIQKLYPDQKKPAWLQNSKPIALSTSANDRQSLLHLASHTADPAVKAHLESLIKANPLDKDVRNALLSMAQRQGDKTAVLRHKSIFQPVARSYKNDIFKLLLIVFIIAAVCWCLFSATPGSKTADNPYGKTLWRELSTFLKNYIKNSRRLD